MNALRIVALVAAGGLIGGCSKGNPGSNGEASVSPVTAVSPAPGAAGVPRQPTIAVRFGHPMDSASAVGHFAVHMGDSSGPIVPGHMTWDSAYRHMTFVPDSMLAPGTMYSVYMRNGMMTRGTMMGSGGGMGGMGGTGHGMSASPMMFNQAMPGAATTGGGMMWSFTTGGP